MHHRCRWSPAPFWYRARPAWLALVAGGLVALLFDLPSPSRQTLFDLALLGSVLTCVVGLVTRRERVAVVGGVMVCCLIWFAGQ